MNNYLVLGTGGQFVTGNLHLEGLRLTSRKDSARMDGPKALEIMAHLNRRKETPTFNIKHHTEV